MVVVFRQRSLLLQHRLVLFVQHFNALLVDLVCIVKSTLVMQMVVQWVKIVVFRLKISFFIFDETILFFKTDCGYCATTRVTTAWTCAPITCAPLTCSSGLVPQYSYDTNGCRRGF